MEIGLESSRSIEKGENSKRREEMGLIPSRQLLEEKLKDPEFQREFNRIVVIGEIKKALIQARKRENLIQEKVAKRMGTTKSVISREFLQRLSPYHEKSNPVWGGDRETVKNRV
ncbi:MAG: hypothetical protein ABGW77_02730 [Campylobacterales bacterium]